VRGGFSVRGFVDDCSAAIRQLRNKSAAEAASTVYDWPGGGGEVHHAAMASVLVIEDDDRIRTALLLALEDEGYVTAGAATAEDGLSAQRVEPSDAVLVDLMLPGLDGFDCIRQLRRYDDAPIVVVSARSDTHDIVAALEAGADDYVVKPVAIKELSARLRAMRRRGRNDPAGAESVVVGELRVQRLAGEVFLCGERVALTRTEFRLMCELADHAGMVLSRQQLLERVWEYEFGDERLVDVHIGRLRQKIEDEPSVPRRLLTVRGLGYKLTR